MENLRKLLDQIEKFTIELEISDQRAVEKCLKNLVNIIELTRDELSDSDFLVQVARYTSKKLSDLELSSSPASGSTTALRALRNEIAHGRSLKRIEYPRVKKLVPVLWRTLEMSAELWDPSELGNFLMYCLRINASPVDIHTVEPKKLVRVYRAIYNTLEEKVKEQVFKELALRLFSEKRFVITLENQLVV